MKVLVAVASKHGSTREIAVAIAEELRNAAIDVELQDVGGLGSLTGYDAVILGSAIYAGNWLPEAHDFAEEHRAELSKLPVWLFSSGPLGQVNPQPLNDPEKLAAPLGGVQVRDHAVFVGKLDPVQLGFGERLITKMVGAPSGDFRDWEEIRAWARKVATDLAPATLAKSR